MYKSSKDRMREIRGTRLKAIVLDVAYKGFYLGRYNFDYFVSVLMSHRPGFCTGVRTLAKPSHQLEYSLEGESSKSSVWLDEVRVNPDDDNNDDDD